MSARPPRTIRLAEDRWANVRHIVEVVAIVAAGLWGFYVFIYQERIKPAGEPAALVPSVVVERLGRDAHRDVLRVSLRFRNTGKGEIDIAADAFNIWGDRYGSRPVVATEDTPNHRVYANTVPLVSTHLLETRSELRQSAQGGRKGYNFVIESGASNDMSYVIVIPRGTYDLIRAQVIAVPVKFPVSSPVRVTMQRLRDGAAWLRADSPGTFEDDADVQFALIP